MTPDSDRYVGTVATTASGVYDIRVIATGGDLRGDRFSREELRSLAVWTRGDAPSPTVIEPRRDHNIDLCRLLACLLEQDSVRAVLKRHEIEPESIVKCIEEACRQVEAG